MEIRQLKIREPRTVDEKNKTIELILATENAVNVGGGEQEILDMSGVVLPDQIPLLDSHDRGSIDKVLGQITNLSIETTPEGRQLVGRAFIQDEAVFEKIKSGVLTDVSVGFIVEESEQQKDGSVVIKKWDIREASLVSIGADSASKVRELKTRSEYLDRTQTAINLCKEHKIMDKLERVRDAGDLKAQHSEILEINAENQTKVSSISFGLSEVEKRDSGIEFALKTRAMDTCGFDEKTREKIYPEEKRHAGFGEHLRHRPLYELAKESLHADGMPERELERLSRRDISLCALGFGNHLGLSTRSAYHTSGSFPTLLLDTARKSLFGGFEAAPDSWKKVFKQSESAQDFKTFRSVRLGSVDNLDVWPDGTKPNEKELLEEFESSAIESYSNMLTFSYRSIVNDEMDVLSTAPMKLGMAASRTVNTEAWRLLLDNPTMRDGNTLFSASHAGSNLATGSVSDYLLEINTLISLLMNQVGLSGNRLGIQPAFLAGPPELNLNLRQVVESTFTPSIQSFASNPFQGLMEPVIEPILSDTTNFSGASTTAFYVLGDPNLWSSVEIKFLEGQEQPVIRSWQSDEDLSLKYSVLQSFSTHLVDWRPIVRHSGE